MKQKEITKEHLDNLKLNLQKTRVEVIAEIGETVLTLGEILTLEVGDVIRLKEHYDEPIEIKVNGKTKFLAKPGQYKGNYAVRITEIIEEGENNDE